MAENVLMGKTDDKPIEKTRQLHRSDLLPESIDQRHLKEIKGIKFGDVADLPDGGSHTKCYFALDESKLYLYNSTNEAWESTTLS